MGNAASRRRSSVPNSGPPAASPAGAAQKPEAAWWPWVLLLALVTLCAYLPAIRGGYIWDDDYYADNPLLDRPGALATIWSFRQPAENFYRDFPMTYTSFWVERHLWGKRPLGYHLDNVLLHIANAILVWLILKRCGVRGAGLAGAIFALHPVHVESVAWIAERKNVLSGFFFLSAFYGYLAFEEGKGRRWYWGALAAFLFALLSKAVTATLPVVLPLALWHRTGKLARKDAARLLPFFAVAFAVGLFTLWVETHSLRESAEFHLSVWQRALLAGRAFWFYPLKLLYPAGLTFSYERWALDPRDWTQWLWPATALIGCGWLFRKYRMRGIAAAVGFYVVTILPLLGFVNVYTYRYAFVADHYQYLASLGLILLFAAVLEAPVESQRRRAAMRAAALATLLVLGFLTWRRCAIYQNDERIWLDTLSKNPSSPLAHNNLGVLLLGRGRAEEAIPHFREALRFKPDYPEAQYNLGFSLALRGQLDDAIAHYQEAVRLKPDYEVAHYNMAVVLAARGRLEEAAAHYGETVKINPNSSQAHHHLGVALGQLGRLEEAQAHLREAVRIKPDYLEAHFDLAVALARQKGFADAAKEFQEVLRIDPGYEPARRNLDVLLRR